MARFLGAMVVAAATLALVWVVLPSPPESDRTAIAVLAVGTEAAGLLLLSGLLDAQPRVVFEFAVALGTAVVSLGDYLARVRGTGLPLLYLWAVPYSFWYFPWRRAAIQAGLVVAGFAAASLAASAAHPALAGRPSSDWGPVLLMAGTAVIVGEFVRRLRLAVAESHRRFARIFVSAPTPMALLSLDGHYVDVNGAFCAAVGRERGELLGRSLFDLVPDDQHEQVAELVASLASGHTTSRQLERDYLRPDGTRVSLLTNVSVLGPPREPGAEMLVQGLDLTERKRADVALAASEERYRTLVETTQAIVWASDTEGTLTFVNDAVEDLLGYRPEELVGRPLTAVLPEAHHGASAALLGEIALHGTMSGEAAHRRRDGSTIVASYRVAGLRDGEGRSTGFVGTVVDVTARHRAQEALRVSEAQLRAVIDNAPAVITIRGADGRLRVVNRQAARLLGVEPDELLGKSFEDLHPSGAADELRLADGSVLELGEPVVQDLRYSFPDGERFFLAVAFPLPAGREGEPMVCRISFDVTDRERARHELERIHEQRRQLLAELVRAQEDERRRIAADVHDESIQVLAGVAIRLGLLTSLLDRPEQQRLIAGLDESVRRGIKSLRQLLFDLRLPALDELGLAAALRSYLSETIAREGATYTLEDRLEVEPPAELRTVLYRVAQEALSNVRKHAQATHVEVELHGNDAGFTVLVRDAGVGFEAGEPVGEAPGHLGLVGLRERIQAAGGWIEVRSAPGLGTTVEFGLPAGRDALAPVPGPGVTGADG